MKTLLTISLILSTLTLWGQGVDEAYFFSKENSFGTARSMGMGGSFGALGADMSAISINPAGVALFRVPEFTFTPSIQLNNSSSDYTVFNATDNKTRFTVSQIGYVGVNRVMREEATGIISTNFAVNYQRVNDFNNNTQIFGKNIHSSLLDQLRFEADNEGGLDNLNIYRSNLAYKTGVLDLVPNSNPSEYYNALEYYDEISSEIYRETPNGINQWNNIEQRGNASELGGSAGININNKIFLGGSLNINFLSYNKDNYYSESDPNFSIPYLQDYSYNTFQDLNGVGLNLKFGIIVKPINAIRLGLAYQTPTWYTISEYYVVEMNSIVEDNVTDNNYASANSNFEYSYSTPQKLTGSLALILGEKVAINIDYKYINYSSAKYNATTTDYTDAETMNFVNQEIKDIYKATNNVNFGMEYKPIANIALRGGFIYNESGLKYQDYNTLSYTGGIGYREKNYFIDLAYRFQTYKLDHYMYMLDASLTDPAGYNLPNDYVTTTYNSNLVVLTMGVKF